MRRVRYRLYALPQGGEGAAAAGRTRFYRMTGDYVLVYKRGRGPGGSVEVRDESLLTAGDRAWLEACNRAILEEFARDHAQGAETGMERFLERLEEELERSAEKPGAGDYCPAVGDEGALRMGRTPCG